MSVLSSGGMAGVDTRHILPVRAVARSYEVATVAGEVLAVADEITVIRAGTTVAAVLPDQVTARQLAELMVGSELPVPDHCWPEPAMGQCCAGSARHRRQSGKSWHLHRGG